MPKTGRPKTVDRMPWTTTINPRVLEKLQRLARMYNINVNEELECLINEEYAVIVKGEPRGVT